MRQAEHHSHVRHAIIPVEKDEREPRLEYMRETNTRRDMKNAELDESKCRCLSRPLLFVLVTHRIRT